MMLHHWAWLLGWGVAWVAVTPLDAEQMRSFQQTCQGGAHVSCIRAGLGWLQQQKLPDAQKYKIYLAVAKAYDALGRQSDTIQVLQRFASEQPCRRVFSTSNKGLQQLYQRVRKRVLSRDTGPPILTFTVPGKVQFQSDGVLRAQVSDDLKVRDVVLMYRTSATSAFQALPFLAEGFDQYRVVIPATMRGKLRLFEFYVRARDCTDRNQSLKGSPTQPLRLDYRVAPAKANGRLIAGGVSMAVGALALVGGALAFGTAFNTLERWENTLDLNEAENMRSDIIFFHGIGWAGAVIGVGALGLGSYLLFIRPRLQKTPQQAEEQISEAGAKEKGRSGAAMSQTRERSLIDVSL